MQVIREQGKPIKAWIDGVELEDQARSQLVNISRLPFIYKHLAVMPDVHYGIGATVGSVVPTEDAIIPAAVGVDIGCGMMAVKTNLTANDMPDTLTGIRTAIEAAVPVGQSSHGDHSMPMAAKDAFPSLYSGLSVILNKHREIEKEASKAHLQLGTLGGGNHFVEICLDKQDNVWVMLHSGSRGIGNAIGRLFIEKARQEMRRWHINLPDEDLAYFPEGTEHFYDYTQAVHWAQDYARQNREVMMVQVIAALEKELGRKITFTDQAVNCHHNYVAKENHFGKNIWVTRKGAVSAREGQLGIIPGSMGARSFIVRGKGNTESFCSCSHGAGRRHGRKEAKRLFTLEQHIQATKHVECRKDMDVIDETPMAYKDIDAVMAAQTDLVDIVYELRQIVCVKG